MLKDSVLVSDLKIINLSFGVNVNKSVFVWSSNLVENLKNSLYGYLITNDAIVLGQSGLDEYLSTHAITDLFREKNGKFVLAAKSDEGVRISSDYFGLEPVFYYHYGDVWVISNSFLALSKELGRLGIKQNFYTPSLGIFSLSQQGLFSGQLLSNNTVLEGVKLLPLGKSIFIDNKSGFRIESEEKASLDVHQDSYQEAIAKFLQSAHARMHALAALVTPDCFVDLSGGQDSRLVFGLAAKSHAMSKSVFARSNKGMDDDYQVAAKVAKFYEMPLKSAPFNGQKIDGVAAFDLWALANAGVYRPVYIPVTDHPRRVLQFTGANFLGKAYLTKSVEARLESWRPFLSQKTFDEIASEFYGSFRDMGVSPESEEAMSMHYMHHRARIHYGRAWYSHLFWTNHSPLLSSEFLSTAQIGVELGYSKDRIMCDVMFAIDKNLVKLPFSNDKSQFLAEDIEQSARSVRPVDFSIGTEMRVYGDFDDYKPSSIEPDSTHSFEDVFKSRFHATKKGVKSIGVFGEKFIEEGEIALKKSKNVREWNNASVIVGIGLVLDNM